MFEFDEEKFAERLKTAVKMAGGNKDVAAKIDINSVSLSRYVTGKSSPTAGVLAKIASVCGVSTDFLLYGDRDDEHSDFDQTEVLNTVRGIATQLADFDHPHIKINIQAEAFGDAFVKLVRYKLEENASSETMDNVIKFSFSKR